jgi:uncharacterized protein (TIGR03382 family)
MMPRRRCAGLTSATLAALFALLGNIATASGSPVFFVSAQLSDNPHSTHTDVAVLKYESSHAVTLQSEYEGPTEHFAMLTVVPASVRAQDVTTVPREVFAKLARRSDPRLVEYWEQDPCAPEADLSALAASATGNGITTATAPLGLASTTSTNAPSSPAPTELKQAKGSSGEYTITLLAGADAKHLDAWLRAHKYTAPTGTMAALQSYLNAGMKVLVAEIDGKKLSATAGGGATLLSPLRIHFEASAWALPMQFGILNSASTQDLVLHVLASQDRYQLAGRESVLVPTNLLTNQQAKVDFGAFYTSIFNATSLRAPGAGITEYVWPAADGDDALQASDLSALGAETSIFQSGKATSAVGFLQFEDMRADGALPAPVAHRVARASLGAYRTCFDLENSRSAIDSVRYDITLTIDAKGVVAHNEAKGKQLAGYPELETCLTRISKSIAFPRSASDITTSRFTLNYRAPSTRDTSLIPLRAATHTRMHLRYSTAAPGADLAFTRAAGVTGGLPSMFSGTLDDLGAQASSGSQFQARYIYRTAFSGPVSCAKPLRGHYGGAPGTNAAGGAITQFANRLKIPQSPPVAGFLTAENPDPFATARPAVPNTTPVAAAPSSPASAAPAAKRGFCSATPNQNSLALWPLAALITLALARRRSQLCDK